MRREHCGDSVASKAVLGSSLLRSFEYGLFGLFCIVLTLSSLILGKQNPASVGASAKSILRLQIAPRKSKGLAMLSKGFSNRSRVFKLNLGHPTRPKDHRHQEQSRAHRPSMHSVFAARRVFQKYQKLLSSSWLPFQDLDMSAESTRS